MRDKGSFLGDLIGIPDFISIMMGADESFGKNIIVIIQNI